VHQEAAHSSPVHRGLHHTPSVSLNTTPSCLCHVCHLWTTNTGRRDVAWVDLSEGGLACRWGYCREQTIAEDGWEYIMDPRGSDHLELQWNYYCMPNRMMCSECLPKCFLQLQWLALQAAIGTSWALRETNLGVQCRTLVDTFENGCEIRKISKASLVEFAIQKGLNFHQSPSNTLHGCESCHHQRLCYKLLVTQERPVSGDKRCIIQESPSFSAQLIQTASLMSR
jgi:hypothetical protein